MPALLQLDQVSKRYGALQVTDTLSLEVGETEALGVLGPNGAGKTTLFNLITGDAAPNAGRILFGGQDITAMAPHLRCRMGIGRSYQIPHPFAKMTVFENLVVAAIYGGGRTERDSYRRCADVMELTGLESRANEVAGSLTLLQRKRLESSALSLRHDRVRGFSAAAVGVANVSPPWPPKINSSVPVHTEAYCSRTPSGPLGRRRQLLLRGSYNAPPAGPSGELPAHTTIWRPVHAAAGPPPPRTPDGAFAILRHVRATGS